MTRTSDLAASADDLREQLAEVTAAVDGVVRLEPTLRTALRRIQSSATSVLADGRSVRSAADGIQLHRSDDRVDVHVDIVTTPTPAAAVTAQAVRDAITSTLRSQDLAPGRVTVAVLSVDH